MGRIAVEILPPLARDEGGTAFRVKDDRILSQDARARIFDVKTASHRGLSELLVGKPFFRFDLQIPRLAPCVSRWNAGLPSSRGARSANGALLSRVRDSVLRARRCGTQACRPHTVRGRRTARYCRGSWDGVLRRGCGRGTRACRPRAVRDWRMTRYCRRSGTVFSVHGVAERRLTVLARGAVGEQRVIVGAHGTAAFAVGVAANAGLPSSRGTRSANGALFSRFMEQRLSPGAALWSAVSGRFAFTVETRRFP